MFVLLLMVHPAFISWNFLKGAYRIISIRLHPTFRDMTGRTWLAGHDRALDRSEVQ